MLSDGSNERDILQSKLTASVAANEQLRMELHDLKIMSSNVMCETNSRIERLDQIIKECTAENQSLSEKVTYLQAQRKEEVCFYLPDGHLILFYFERWYKGFPLD